MMALKRALTLGRNELGSLKPLLFSCFSLHSDTLTRLLRFITPSVKYPKTLLVGYCALVLYCCGNVKGFGSWISYHYVCVLLYFRVLTSIMNMELNFNRLFVGSQKFIVKKYLISLWSRLKEWRQKSQKHENIEFLRNDSRKKNTLESNMGGKRKMKLYLSKSMCSASDSFIKCICNELEIQLHAAISRSKHQRCATSIAWRKEKKKRVTCVSFPVISCMILILKHCLMLIVLPWRCHLI